MEGNCVEDPEPVDPCTYVSCDDGDPCTIDTCVTTDDNLARCVPVSREDCGDGLVCDNVEGEAHCVVAPCANDAECQDENPCTQHTCTDGVCELVPNLRDGNLPACEAGEVCDAFTGDCVLTALCDEGQLPCDNDNEYVRFCEGGQCLEVERAGCQEGFERHPDTFVCQEPTECVEGALQCQTIDEVMYEMVCSSGFWVQNRVCGPVSTGRCFVPTGVCGIQQ